MLTAGVTFVGPKGRGLNAERPIAGDIACDTAARLAPGIVEMIQNHKGQLPYKLAG